MGAEGLYSFGQILVDGPLPNRKAKVARFDEPEPAATNATATTNSTSAPRALVFEFFRAAFWQTQARDGSGGFQNVINGIAATLDGRGDVALVEQFAELVACFGLQALGRFAVLGLECAEGCGQGDGLRGGSGWQRIFREDIFQA